MPNQFMIQPANPLRGLNDVVGGAVQQNQLQKQEQEQKRQLGLKLKKASGLITAEDTMGLANFMTQNPDLRDHMISIQKFASDTTRAAKIQSLKDIVLGGNRKEIMKKQIDLIRSEGGDSTEAEMFMESTATDEEAIEQALAGLAIEDPAAAKAWMESTGYEAKKAEKKFQQGTGIMTGYSFDPATGKFSIDADMQQALQADATKLAAMEKLDAKAVSGVNDKVTALTKDVRGIHAAAKSLEGLKKSSSAAAKVAAVFKFMKALDPTSTVRESELGMVYSAEGAAQGLANKLTKLLGEGAISDAGFKDLVDTSKNMSNSAVESSRTGVTGYLNVIRDNLSPKQFKNMNDRVPAMFEITPVVPDTPAPQAALDFLQANPTVIEEFETKYGYRPEGY